MSSRLLFWYSVGLHNHLIIMMIAIFLDIETTGLDPTLHSPIDLAMVVIDLDQWKVLGEYQSLIKQTKETWDRSDPSSIEINGYRWEEICNGKDPKLVREEVILLLNRFGVVRKKAVFICQNPAFDRAFFTQIIPVYTQEEMHWPYHWLDLASMYWTKVMNRIIKGGLSIPPIIDLSKNSIAGNFNIPPEEKPHKAINGVNHLIKCYRAVMNAVW